VKEYVLGFFFSEDRNRVVLLRKNRPEFLAGKWNGVGGKLEEDEAPVDAIRREFLEEAGVDVSGWEFFLSFEVNDNGQMSLIHVFFAFGDVTRTYTRTDEPVNHFAVGDLSNIRTMSTIQWLIPMMLDTRICDGLLNVLLPQRAPRLLCQS
jgi:8-oxo-dGTP diphosphatase